MDDRALAEWIRVTDRAFVALSEEGNIRFWNGGAETILGYALEDLIDQPISTVMPSRYDADRQAEIWYRLAEAGKMRSPPIELIFAHRDESERSIEVAVSYWVQDGQGFFGLALTDLGPILELQDELMRLASFPEFNPAPVVELEVATGNVFYANEAWFSLSSHAQEALTTQALLPSNEEHRVAICYVREQVFELRIHQISAWQCVRGYVRDVTQRHRAELRMRHEIQERKKAELAAQKASQAKSAFLAHVSHELRTPLNAIIGYSELVEESLTDPQGLADLSRVSRSAWALLTLIDSILDLSKVEAGKMEADLRPFSVQDLLRELEVAIEPLVHRNGNRLLVIRERHFDQMCSDEQKIRQILTNLVSNASKFTSNGEIEVCAQRAWIQDVMWAEFTVRDSGVGLAPEKMAKIFEPFAQADAQIQSTYGGTGLGLAICRQFCELLQGTISASSELGVGTTFTVRIPADASGRPESGRG